MPRVTGIGGVFFRAADPAEITRWYVETLGLPIDEEGYTVVRYVGDETVTWAAFPADTGYFGEGEQTVMINYRVDDLDGVLQRVRDSGGRVDDHVEEHEFGRFGWAFDPEGHRFELWQPATGH